MNRLRWHKLCDSWILPMLALVVGIFILMPFFYILKEAFVYEGRWDISRLRDIILENIPLLKNSLIVAVLTSILTVIAASATAIYIYIERPFIREKILFILSITMISPPFVTALSYINLFGRRGLISYRLLHLSIQPYGMWGIVLMQMLSEFSLATLLIYGVLKGIPVYMIDAARSLGAKTGHIISDILIPAMLPGLKATFILAFLQSIADFGTPAIIGGNFDVLATESYFAVIAEGDLHKAAAINILMLLPSMIAFIFYQKSLRNIKHQTHGSSSSEVVINRQGLLYMAIKAMAIFFILWISTQYTSLILSSFTAMKKGNLTFSLKNVMDSLPYLDESLIRSIVYSFIAALGASVLGILIAYYAAYRSSRLAKFTDMIANLPYVLPGTFFGLGYILSFKQAPFLLVGTSAIVVLNLLFKQLPFSTKMGNSAMEMIDIAALNSIRDLGGSRIDELRDGVLPLSKSFFLMSFVNIFNSTMTSIGSIIFLVYPGQKVLTLVMFDAIQSGKYGVGSVLALVIIVVCVIFTKILHRLAG